MRIAIIETGAPPPALQEIYGGYPAMMERMFASGGGDFSFFTAPVFEGAPTPRVDSFDGVLITGSPAGVYEGHDWIAPLENLIRETARAGKPQVGICFGHQLMAQALGGRVVKSDRGWGVGLHAYALEREEPWMSPFQMRIACAVSHQDQVVETPKGARVIGGSEFCPNGVLAYAQGPAISFQMHPEFEHAFAADLLRAREGRIAREIVSDGLSSLAQRSDRGLIARWITNFYHST